MNEFLEERKRIRAERDKSAGQTNDMIREMDSSFETNDFLEKRKRKIYGWDYKTSSVKNPRNSLYDLALQVADSRANPQREESAQVPSVVNNTARSYEDRSKTYPWSMQEQFNQIKNIAQNPGYNTKYQMSQPDFKEMSQAGAEVKNPSYDAPFRAPWQKIGNKAEYAHSVLGDSMGVYGDGANIQAANDHVDDMDYRKNVVPFMYLSDSERAVYNYHLGKNGKNAADDYLDSLKDILSERETQDITKEVDRPGSGYNSNLSKTVYSFGTGVKGSIDGMKQFPDMWLGNDKVEQLGTQDYVNSYIRENEKSKPWKTAYDVAGAIGYMVPPVAIGSVVSPAIGNTAFGLSTAGNSYAQSIREGQDVESSQSYALIQGVSEGLSQAAIGGVQALGGGMISKALGGTGVAKAIESAVARLVNNEAAMAAIRGSAKYVGSAFDEGLQEYVQELGDKASRNIIFGENNEVALTDPDAWYNAMLGAVTAGTMNIPNAAMDIGENIDIRNRGKEINPDYRDYLESIDTDESVFNSYNDYQKASDLKKLALEYVDRQKSGGYIGNYEKGRFDQEMNSYMNDLAEHNLQYDSPVQNYEVNPAQEQVQPAAETNEIEEPFKPSIPSLQAEPFQATRNIDTEGYNSAPVNVHTPQITAATSALELYANEYKGSGKTAFVDSYDGKSDPDAYSKGFNAFYGEGRYGMEYGQSGSLYGAMLDSSAAEAAYKAGMADRNASVMVKTKTGPAQSGGLVAAAANASEAQKAFTDKVGQKTGLKFELVDSMEDSNGEYNGQKGTVRIALDSDNFAGTIAHELTHYIKDYASEEYQSYQDIVVPALMQAEGVSTYEKLVDTYFDRYQQTDREFTREDAVDEIASDAAEKFLSDPELIEETIKSNRTVGQRIHDFLSDLVESIKEMVQNAKDGHVSKMLHTNLEKAQQAQELWYKALDKASENRNQGSTIFAEENQTIKYSKKETLKQQLGRWLTGNMGIEEYFYVGNTPECLSKLGASQLPMVMSQDVIVKITGEKHSIAVDDIATIKTELDSPLMVFKGTVPDSFVVLTEMEDKEGNPVIVAVHLNKRQNRILVNRIASLYGKKNITNYITTQSKNGNLLYTDNQKSTKWATSRGFQLPKLVQSNGAYNDSIHQNSEKSNNIATKEKQNSQAARPKPALSLGRNVSENNIAQSAEKSNIKSQLKNIVDTDYQEVVDENDKLREANEYLKSQFEITKIITPKPQDISRITNKLLNDYSSAYDKDDLNANLTKLFSYIQNTDQVDGAEVADITASIAKGILQESRHVDTTMSDYYGDVKESIRKTKISLSSQDRADLDAYGGYNDFRKHYFGKINLGNDGISVDTFYDELAGLHPELFDSEITHPADRLIAIADVVDSLKPAYINPYGANLDEMSTLVAGEIFDNYFAISRADPTFSDRKTAELLQVKINYRRRMAAMKQDLKTKYDKRLLEIKKRNTDRIQKLTEKYEVADDEQKEYYRNQIKQLRDFKNSRLLAQQQRFTEKQKNSRLSRKERESVRKYKNRIMQNTADMSKWLLSPTEKKHVPESLKGLTAEFLKSIDFSSGRLNKYGNPTERTNLYFELKDAYQKILDKMVDTTTDEQIFMEIDPDFIPRLEEFISTTKTVKLEDMDSTNLRDLDLIVGIMKHAITDANKLTSNANYQRVQDVSEAFMYENSQRKPHNENIGLLKHTSNLFNVDLLDSRSYFLQTGPAGMTLYDSLRTGFDKKIRTVKISADYIQDLVDKADVKKWTGKHAESKTFHVNGGDVELTTAQIMSLYELNKRDQARSHIYSDKGGIKPTQTIKYTDFEVGTDAHHLKVKKLAVKKEYKPCTVTEEDINTIIATLTPEQMRIADGIAKFFSTQTSEWGNEVSMQMYGYKKFTEENYFPIVSDSNYLVTMDGDTKDLTGTLKNMGSTKSTVKGANNPIMVEDIFDVFTRQADQMGSYNAFVVPLSDLQKFYNYKSKAGGSVKQELDRVFGGKGKEYIKNLMVDINGSSRALVGTEISNRLLGNMKAASVGANLRVIIQQPTSYVRAMAEIDPKYLIKGALKPNKKGDWDRIKEYAPIAQWKDWGFFEMDTGRQMKEIFLGTEGLAKFREMSMAGAGLADTLTWEKLWNAVEYETMDRNKALQLGTEDFYKAVGKRFSEVVDATQVVDSVLHRSQLMRSKDVLTKMSTSFMTEPIKSYNMLRNAFGRAVYERTPESKRKAARSAVTFFNSALTTALAAALIDMFRDEDDEKGYREKYLDAVTSNMEDNINPLNMIPYVKEVVTMLNGFEPSRMELSGINDVVNSAKQWMDYFEDDSKYTIYYLVKNSVSSLSKLLGVPIQNAMRTFDNAFAMIQRNMGDADLNYNVAKTELSIKSDKNISSYTQQIVKAMYDGNNGLVVKIYNEMVLAGIDNESINKRIESGYKKGLKSDPLIQQLYEAKIKSDSKEISQINTELIDQGHPQKWIDSAVKSYGNSLSEDEFTYNKIKSVSDIFDTDLDEDGSIYSSQDMITAIDSSKSADLKIMINDIYQNKVQAGKSKQEARGAIKSALTSHYKPIYVEADYAGRSKIMMSLKLIRVGGEALYDPTEFAKWKEKKK